MTTPQEFLQPDRDLMPSIASAGNLVLADISIAEPEAKTISLVESEPPAIARYLQHGANAVSCVRLVGGVMLARHTAKNEYPSHSWKPAVAAGIIAASDWLDGRLARRAWRYGGRRSVSSAYLDQISDKVMVNGITGALTYANTREGDHITAGLLGIATAATVARDIGVNVKRIQAERSATVIDTSAQKSGKRKAVLQFIGSVASLSPLARNPWSKAAATGTVIAAAWLSAKSGVGYVRAYNAAMQDDLRLPGKE